MIQPNVVGIKQLFKSQILPPFQHLTRMLLVLGKLSPLASPFLKGWFQEIQQIVPTLPNRDDYCQGAVHVQVIQNVQLVIATSVMLQPRVVCRIDLVVRQSV